MNHQSRETQLRDRLEVSLQAGEDRLRTVTTDARLAVTQGWFIRAVDSIRAALRLLDVGLASVASPLVRAAMEHAVGTIWLQEVGDDGLRGLENSHRVWAMNIARATDLMEGRGGGAKSSDWSPEIDALIAQITSAEPAQKVPGEWQHKERFQVAKQLDLYVAWLSETAASHATKESATPYMSEAKGRITLLREPKDNDPSDLVARCAVVAAYALRTMAEVVDSKALGATADRLAGDIRAFLDSPG